MADFDFYLNYVKNYDGPPVKLMEVCGTHTHNIFRYGIPSVLPKNISLISGPGCPVCVTPPGYIDRAAEISTQDSSVLCTFGDMIRVPGNNTSLLEARASGGEVRIMYSPADDVTSWAKKEPLKTFYVAAVGFETTLPVYALLIKRAYEENLGNIRLLLSVKSLLPALYWICENGPGIDGFIGPGHVSAIIGSGAYEHLCRKSGIPLAVSGFGYEQIIAAVYDLLVQSKKKTCFVHNLYPNAVAYGGNTAAMSVISEYFVKKPSFWRGIGEIMDSGYFLSEKYKQFDGGSEIGAGETKNSACLCGSVIIGRARPTDCVFFGKACTPENPLGPCMVSSEGTCGIWHANM